MPISKSVNSENDTTVFRVTGEVNGEEVAAVVVEFLVTAPTPLVIWDIGNGSFRNMTSKDLRTIVDRAWPHIGSRAGGRTALVCESDLDFGMSRMFEMFAGMRDLPFEMRVFRDMAEARRWVGENRVVASKARTFATCIGEAHNTFASHDPPIVGATCLAPSPEYEFGVRFLVATDADLARANGKNLLVQLRRAMEDAVTKHGLPSDEGSLRVELSSLDAQGIKVKRFATS